MGLVALIGLAGWLAAWSDWFGCCGWLAGWLIRFGSFSLFGWLTGWFGRFAWLAGQFGWPVPPQLDE